MRLEDDLYLPWSQGQSLLPLLSRLVRQSVTVSIHLHAHVSLRVVSNLTNHKQAGILLTNQNIALPDNDWPSAHHNH